MAQMTKQEFKGKGGKWLGAARSWIQWNCKHGDSVTWGSNEKLIPELTVKDVEEIALEAAYAEYCIIQHQTFSGVSPKKCRHCINEKCMAVPVNGPCEYKPRYIPVKE